ncbi:MAG: hypothetical protein HC897_11170, partial [Thermoanaerobaculia bacterium]|nr:hypothetical protein [Thermoanaerobaculia bacterium]
MNVDRLLSPEDLRAVRAAVAEAEGKSSGEVVPYVVARCDRYEEARYKASTLFALLAAGLAGAAHTLGDFWGGSGIAWITLPTLVGAAAGYLLGAFRAAFERALVSADVLGRRVEARAAEAFAKKRSFVTRERTGILIFLAMFERRVTVLADSGINARVEPGEWDALATKLAAGIRAGRAGGALV